MVMSHRLTACYSYQIGTDDGARHGSRLIKALD